MIAIFFVLPAILVALAIALWSANLFVILGALFLAGFGVVFAPAFAEG
jgi:hypothetical protein